MGHMYDPRLSQSNSKVNFKMLVHT